MPTSGWPPAAYLAGAVCGALFFGWLTDRLGRKKLFFITLAVYLVATAATALSWNFWSFALFRFLTGAGIGGEYAAINSTIQELIPARVRGWTDLVINGSFWIGAALGAVGAIVLLDPAVIDPEYGWRACVPDRRAAGAGDLLHAAVAAGEPALADDARPGGGGRARSSPASSVGCTARQPVPYRRACRGCGSARAATRRCARCSHTLFVSYRRRTLVGLSLMAAQAFFYNAIFFTYALVLTDFYAHPAEHRSAGTSCRSRPEISSGRCCSGACSTCSAAAR